MARIRYQVAASLDGFIAGPNGEYDWITQDPDIDFAAMFAEYDTFLMGRATYQAMLRDGWGGFTGSAYVFSSTLRQEDHPKVTIVPEVTAEAVGAIREAAKKDVWIFGGGRLFHSMLALGLVDTVEVAVVPALLGDGVPLLPPPALRATMTLVAHRVYEKSGIVLLTYSLR